MKKITTIVRGYLRTTSPLRGVIRVLTAAGLTLGISSCYTAPLYQEDDAAEYQTYVPPVWAPPYDNVSMIRYYYLPDYGVYYDVWERHFWCPENGVWVYYPTLPSTYVGVDLYTSFIVLIDRDVHDPWRRDGYYHDNYPRHGYDNYRDIVEKNRIVTDVEPGHELVPRAYDENNDRVTFMQRPRVNAQAPTEQSAQPNRDASTPNRDVPSQSREVPPQTRDVPRANERAQTPATRVATPQPSTPPQYRPVAKEVPMRAIAPAMPKESRSFNYGSGVRRSAPANTNAAPVAKPAPNQPTNTQAPPSPKPDGGSKN